MVQTKAIAAIKHLTMLDAKRRKKLLDLGIVSTSDMYALENGERIKNKEELSALFGKLSVTDTPVDIRVEDYGEPRFTPMLKCEGLDLDTPAQETKDDANSVPLERTPEERVSLEVLQRLSIRWLEMYYAPGGAFEASVKFTSR
jgi:hypothetical protein